MTKKLIIIAIIIVLLNYLFDLYQDYYYHQLMLESVKDISIKASNIEITVEDNTEWITIFKGVSAILLTYIGIKIVNKII